MRDPHVRLTEEEQRRLEALEAALTADDPQLARRLRCGRRLPVLGVVSGGLPARGPVGAVLLAAGAVMVVVSLLVSLAVAVAGSVAVAAGAYLLLTCNTSVRTLHRFDAWFVPRFFRANRERDEG
jgi:hypothetical protein